MIIVTVRLRRMLLAAFMSLGMSVPTTAGTIRHDRRDELYTDLAGQPQFAASGFLGIFDGAVPAGVASATLIDPEWVLTAAHCVIDDNGPTGTSWRFQIGSEVVVIPPANVYFNPQWVTTGFDSGSDLALLRLPRRLRGVRPAALSMATDDVRAVFTSVGYGSTGDGETGSTRGPGTRRAGQNVFDQTAAVLPIPGFQVPPIPVGNARTLISDFDNPQASQSTLGAAQPLHLEYSAAPGDSGGGAFVLNGSGSRVIGIVSGGFSPNGLAQASYGTTAVYARLATNMPWVRSVIAGRESPLPTMVAQMQQGTFQRGVTLAAQRRAALARTGYHFSHFVLRFEAFQIPEVPRPVPLEEAWPGDGLALPLRARLETQGRDPGPRLMRTVGLRRDHPSP